MIFLVYMINLILIVTVVFFERRDPVVSLAWILCFLAFPIVGMIIFFIFGFGLKRHTKKQYAQKLELASKADVRLNKQLNNHSL